VLNEDSCIKFFQKNQIRKGRAGGIKQSMFVSVKLNPVILQKATCCMEY